MAKTTTGTTPTTRTKKSGASSSTSKAATKSGARSKENTTMSPTRNSDMSRNTSSGSRAPATNAHQTKPSEERERMVQYAAYHIAEKDGFQSGREQDYWLQAEKQVDELFNARKSTIGAQSPTSDSQKSEDGHDADIH